MPPFPHCTQLRTYIERERERLSPSFFMDCLLQLRQKRAASEHLLPEHGSKQLRASVSDNAKQA